jgi:dihydrofolate reductase
VALIAAVAANGVIGRDGGLPWRLSTDLKRFKQLTMGKPVVMGRKTFQSIGKPLPGRTNIVVTRDASFASPGVVVVPDIASGLGAAEAAAESSGVDEVFVIGGAQIYAAAIDLADRLYITHVDAEPVGDARFPAIEPAKWRQVSAEKVAAGEKDTAATTFVVYERS